MKEIKETLVRAFENYPIQSGIIMIGIGVILLLFQLDLKESNKMKEHNVFSYRGFVNKCTLIIMSFLFGIILILKNI